MPDGGPPIVAAKPPLAPRVLILACGALAREIQDVTAANGWHNIDLECLPAILHNTPKDIPAAVDHRLERARETYDSILVGYADCGTGGLLDRVLERHGVERLSGAHCYEFFAGSQDFARLQAEEPGTFYLTDFLVKHFEHLVWRTLGLDRHPQLLDTYFANYVRLVYLAQTRDPELIRRAGDYAARLQLTFEHRHVGYGEMAIELGHFAGADSGEAA